MADVGSPRDDDAPIWRAAQRAGEFFMKTGPVHAALAKITAILEAEHIPYAVIGAMALNHYGYERVTNDVDLLMTRESLERFKAGHLGLGYVEKFAGSKNLRDTESNVGIDVVMVGDYPGDGKPKSVRFPDPVTLNFGGRVPATIPLHLLVELKLASGMAAAHRLKDLADVVELVKMAHLPRELVEHLDASVRGKYLELWTAAQMTDPYNDR